MQKKIIALAVAGLVSGAAFAQSNVTIYGIADVGFQRESGSNVKSVSAIQSGGLQGSRLGFRGTEDLGNGLKAMFVLEYGLAVDANTGIGGGTTPAARQQLVGLTGNFGTVVAGRAQSAGYDWACATNAAKAAFWDVYQALPMATVLSCGGAGRVENAVAYISPSFGGLGFAYNHARMSENANTNATGKDAFANIVSGWYNNGPISAGLVWSKVSFKNTAASDDVTELGLRGSYNFGMATLYGSWQNAKAGDSARNDKWQLSVGVPVSSAGTVSVMYAKSKMKSTAAADNSNGWALGYTHDLSKRTALYTGYGRISNDDAAAVGGPGSPAVIPSAGGSGSTLGFGVRHAF